MSGVNLEEALRRSLRRPLDVTKDMRSGGTAFEQADLDFVVGDGVARLVDGALIARGLKADLRGAVDVANRSLHLRLDAQQSGTTGAAPPDAARLSLDIDGPWSSPTVQTGNQIDSAEPSQAAPTP